MSSAPRRTLAAALPLLAALLVTACGGAATGAQTSTADPGPSLLAASGTSPVPSTTPAPATTATARFTPPQAIPVAPTNPNAPAVRPVAPPATTSPVAPVAAARTQNLPLPYSGAAQQLITVVASSSSSTTATVTAWSRTATGWQAVIGPVQAKVGSDGVGAASESASRTPAGVYGLTQSFGRQANPGAHLPYFQTTTADWWDSNPGSPTYNTHVHQQSSPGGASENLYGSGAVYDYVVNINYNTARTPGAGSAIFLHVTNGSPTAGCIAVPRNTMVAILQWLNPAAGPAIDIGVG